MHAATSGAQADGPTLTVTFDPVNAPGYEGRYLKNVPDKEIVTTNYIDRMFKLMEYGDIFVILRGSGIILEFGTAWVLAKLLRSPQTFYSLRKLLSRNYRRF